MRETAPARELLISLELITDAALFDVKRNDFTASGVRMRLMIAKRMSSPRPFKPPGTLKLSGPASAGCWRAILKCHFPALKLVLGVLTEESGFDWRDASHHATPFSSECTI